MGQTSKPWIVMIVDDDALLRRAITVYLGNRGYEVIGAVHGGDCLDKLSVEMPDIILLDVMMPGLDGWETCRRIREFSEVPIILLTARAQETDREQGSAVGASDYITKPMSLKELVAKVRALLEPPASNSSSGAPTSASP